MINDSMTVTGTTSADEGIGANRDASLIATPNQALAPALAALAIGDFRGAAKVLEEVVTVAPDLALAHEMLGGLSLGVLDDYPQARRHFETAYRLHRKAGDLAAATRAAIAVAQVESTSGNRSGARGWLSRAKRLIEQIGPCVEEGYYRIAMMGCEVPDVSELQASAGRALEVARTFRDTNLEIRALAESGLALISLGHTSDGLERLDEALAAVTSGEVPDFVTCGFTCCAVLSACSLLGDIERLTRLMESLRRVATDRFNGYESPILTSHCHQTYGTMLVEAGRWQEAEEELRRAVEVSVCAGHRAAAMASLAELRIHQNRTVEAAALLQGWEDRLETAAAQAKLHDTRDELDLAVSVLRWALRAQETNLVASAPLWAHLVDLECRRGPASRSRMGPGDRVAAADQAASCLESIADRLASPGVRALARLSRARVQAARGEDTASILEATLRELGDDEQPRLRAEIHIALANAEQKRDVAAATTQARAGLAIFERLGSHRDADRAAGLLRSLGVSVRVGADAGGRRGLQILSRREREVVPLLSEGLSNAEIAQRLFITSKTVEHHISNILARLGLRTRTEVAAWAHRTAAGR
jgi:DNA-binding CsgD family transcriptional regulator/Tfp pilus assembly protein PilF